MVDACLNPVSAGVLVTFVVPSVGPSGTFAGRVDTAMTDADGVATSVAFTANGRLGSYSVLANVTGAVSSERIETRRVVSASNNLLRITFARLSAPMAIQAGAARGSIPRAIFSDVCNRTSDFVYVRLALFVTQAVF